MFPPIFYPFFSLGKLRIPSIIFPCSGQMDRRMISIGQGWDMKTLSLVCILARSKRRSNASCSSLLKARRNGFNLSCSDSRTWLKGITVRPIFPSRTFTRQLPRHAPKILQRIHGTHHLMTYQMELSGWDCGAVNFFLRGLFDFSCQRM